MRYSCPPLKREDLRNYARKIRENLHLEQEPYFPVIRFLESLHLLDETFVLQIISDDEWNQGNDVHAFYDVLENAIYVRESVYIGASDGNGRDRMTIIHECAHFLLLGLSHLKLTRSFDGDQIPAYRDPEWQAKCLAGELLIPYDLVRGLSVEEAARVCGVSETAAHYQMDHYNKRKSG